MEEYFPKLSDEQIEQIIKELTPYQKEKFDSWLYIMGKNRLALLYAKSFAYICLPDHEHINE
jgi:hypothetical protein